MKSPYFQLCDSLGLGNTTDPRLCFMHLCISQLPNPRSSMEKVLHEFQFTGMDGERECVCREVGSLLDAVLASTGVWACAL